MLRFHAIAALSIIPLVSLMPLRAEELPTSCTQIKIERVSVPSIGTQAQESSMLGDVPLSQDGRYLVYSSSADMMGNGSPANKSNIYLRDNVLKTIQQISIAPSNQQPDGSSYRPSITPDGNYILFQSYARNLLPPGVFPAWGQYYLWSRATDSIKLFYIPDQSLDSVTMSADARRFAFVSSATASGPSQAFQYDSESGTVTQITNYNLERGVQSTVISANGRYIAYAADDSLLAAPQVAKMSLWLYDSLTFERVQIAGNGNRMSSLPVFSADNRFLTYAWEELGKPNRQGYNYSEIFVYDISQKTSSISGTSEIEQLAFVYHTSPDISADGRMLTYKFAGEKPLELFPVTGSSVRKNALVFDRVSKKYSQFTYGPGCTAFNADIFDFALSADGRTLAFSTGARNLVSNDTNEKMDIFMTPVFITPDECPSDPEKTAPGVCGCGKPDSDTNSNSIIDCEEPAPQPTPIAPIATPKLSAPQVSIQKGKIKIVMTDVANSLYTIIIRGKILKSGGSKRPKAFQRILQSSSPELTLRRLAKGRFKIQYSVSLNGASEKLATSPTKKLRIP